MKLLLTSIALSYNSITLLEKTHECKICSKRFINKFKLSNHETTHSSERPHVCEQCGAAFKTSDGLVVHMKRHNGTLKKRFSCNQCSLKFTSMNRLQTHLLTHTGEVRKFSQKLMKTTFLISCLLETSRLPVL